MSSEIVEPVPIKRQTRLRTRTQHLGRLIRTLLMSGIALLIVLGCGSEPAAPAPQLSPETTGKDSGAIILADIDPDNPAKKIKRFLPLAKYLAGHLGEFGITEGRVTIARDFEEMARLLQEGKADIYFDSPFPTLTVQELSGSEIILRRWKGGDPTYWSAYVALRDNGVASVEDLVGKVVAFEEPHSTSGFLLPAGALIERGFSLREVDGPDSSVGPGEVGYFFSIDEQNTIELLFEGKVAGAGISNQDYEDLPPEIKPRIMILDETIAVPRQLVSIRPGLDRRLADKIRELLIGLDQTEDGRAILEGLKKTKKFDPLPAESEAALANLKELMKLVAGN